MNRVKGFISKLTYAISANAISLIVSILTTLLIPKFLGDSVEQYGYYQIYVFYTGYIGFFHFGWSDGIMLRDGGKRYEDLDKSLYSSQFWLITLLEGIITVLILLSGLCFAKNTNDHFIINAVAATVLLLLPRTQLAYYLQTTNRIKEYALITAACRLVFGISIIVIYLFGKIDYRLFIYGDIFGKLVALLIASYICRDIILTKPVRFIIGIKEALINISIGCKLLFANIASLLVTGIVRWGIQVVWDVSIYGKISFTLSVANLFLTFISAIAVVLYPTLRRTNEEKLPHIYSTLRNMLMIPVLASLVLYYPVQSVLSVWLPQYAESMKYMAILFPLCIYAAKMNMLVQTYMKVFRMEKQILWVNIIGVGVATFNTGISVFLMKNLTLAMLSIVINQMVGCIYAEYALSKRIHIKVVKDTIVEIVLTVLFILSSWYIGGWFGVICYAIGYIVYVIIKIPEINLAVRMIKRINN